MEERLRMALESGDVEELTVLADWYKHDPIEWPRIVYALYHALGKSSILLNMALGEYED